MSKAPAKAGASNFRARRLSVSDDAKEAEKQLGGLSVGDASPSQAKPRQRRTSVSPEMGVIKPKALLPFPLDIVGTYSCHGVEPGIRQGETSAKINQDRGAVSYPFGPERSRDVTMALFCVFDGHGALGDKVSHYTMNTLQQQLEDHPDLIDDPEKAMKEAFLATDGMLKKDATIDAELSGTTAVVCLFVADQKNNLTVFTANAGDSRAVLAQKKTSKKVAKNLSEDQKPDTPAEKRRIVSRGGTVSPPEPEWGGPARVWIDASMTMPGLAMARSIGDHLVSRVGVVAEPEVTRHDVGAEDDFLVIASDGVYEFLESQPVVDLVASFIVESATEACTRLIETAAAKWRQEEGDYRDDITAICIKMPEVKKLMLNSE